MIGKIFPSRRRPKSSSVSSASGQLVFAPDDVPRSAFAPLTGIHSPPPPAAALDHRPPHAHGVLTTESLNSLASPFPARAQGQLAELAGDEARWSQKDGEFRRCDSVGKTVGLDGRGRGRGREVESGVEREGKRDGDGNGDGEGRGGGKGDGDGEGVRGHEGPQGRKSLDGASLLSSANAGWSPPTTTTATTSAIPLAREQRPRQPMPMRPGSSSKRHSTPLLLSRSLPMPSTVNMTPAFGHTAETDSAWGPVPVLAPLTQAYPSYTSAYEPDVAAGPSSHAFETPQGPPDNLSLSFDPRIDGLPSTFNPAREIGAFQGVTEGAGTGEGTQGQVAEEDDDEEGENGEDGEDDLDTNPLYDRLTTDPALGQVYDHARLILVPLGTVLDEAGSRSGAAPAQAPTSSAGRRTDPAAGGREEETGIPALSPSPATPKSPFLPGRSSKRRGSTTSQTSAGGRRLSWWAGSAGFLSKLGVGGSGGGAEKADLVSTSPPNHSIDRFDVSSATNPSTRARPKAIASSSTAPAVSSPTTSHSPSPGSPPDLAALLASDAYVALHALAPSPFFRDQWVSVLSLAPGLRTGGSGEVAEDETQRWAERTTVTALVDSDSDSIGVRLAFRAPPPVRVGSSAEGAARNAGMSVAEDGALGIQTDTHDWRRLSVVGETTVYRTVDVPVRTRASAASSLTPVTPFTPAHPRTATSTPTPTPTPTPTSGTSAVPTARPTSTRTRSGFEVLSRPPPPPAPQPRPPPPLSSPRSPMTRQEKVKVRVLSVNGWVVPPDLGLRAASAAAVAVAVAAEAEAETAVAAAALVGKEEGGRGAGPKAERKRLSIDVGGRTGVLGEEELMRRLREEENEKERARLQDADDTPSPSPPPLIDPSDTYHPSAAASPDSSGSGFSLDTARHSLLAPPPSRASAAFLSPGSIAFPSVPSPPLSPRSAQMPSLSPTMVSAFGLPFSSVPVPVSPSCGVAEIEVPGSAKSAGSPPSSSGATDGASASAGDGNGNGNGNGGNGNGGRVRGMKTSSASVGAERPPLSPLYGVSGASSSSFSLGRLSGMGSSSHVAGASGASAGAGTEARHALARKRRFFADLHFLLRPPPRPSALSLLSPALLDALTTVVRLSHEFCSTFVYVRGFDAYVVSRVRKGIWAKAIEDAERRIEVLTLTAERASSSSSETDCAEEPDRVRKVWREESRRVAEVLENIVMGFLHPHLYPAIAPLFEAADVRLNHILRCYLEDGNVTLKALGVDLPALRQEGERRFARRLGRAVRTLAKLGDGSMALYSHGFETDLPSVLAALDVDVIAHLAGRADDEDAGGADDDQDDEMKVHSYRLSSRSVSRSSGSVYLHSSSPEPSVSAPVVEEAVALDNLIWSALRTPLDTVFVIKDTIDEIVRAVEQPTFSSSRSSLDLSRLAAAAEGTKITADNLLPLLAYVIVRSGINDLEALMYYASTFRFVDRLPADLNWAFVTFQAAVGYLRADPFNASAHLSEPSAESHLSGSRRTGSVSTTSSRRSHARPSTAPGVHNYGHLSSRSLSGAPPPPSPPPHLTARTWSGRSPTLSFAPSSSAGADSAEGGLGRVLSLPSSSIRRSISAANEEPRSSVEVAMSTLSNHLQDDDAASVTSLRSRGRYVSRPASIRSVESVLNSGPSQALADDSFKFPGRPASASISAGSLDERASRTLSSSRSIRAESIHSLSGRETYDSASRSSSPLGADDDSLVRRRTTSLSTRASSDLVVRPQIIVRPSHVRQPTQSIAFGQEPSLRTDSLSRRSTGASTRSVRVVGKPLEAGGNTATAPPMSRGGSDELEIRARRRQSLDSWAALSLFGGASSSSGPAAATAGRSSPRQIDGEKAVPSSPKAGRQQPSDMSSSLSVSDEGASPSNDPSSAWLPWSKNNTNASASNDRLSSSPPSPSGGQTPSTEPARLEARPSSGSSVSSREAPLVNAARRSAGRYHHRPRSVMSASSASSLDTDSDLGITPPSKTLHDSLRRQRAFGLASSSPLPPRLERFEASTKLSLPSGGNTALSLTAQQQYHAAGGGAHGDGGGSGTGGQMPAVQSSSNDNLFASYFQVDVPSPVMEIRDPLHHYDYSPTDQQGLSPAPKTGAGAKSSVTNLNLKAGGSGPTSEGFASAAPPSVSLAAVSAD